MIRLADPIFWFFLLVGIVWVHRARKALETLAQVPLLGRPEKDEMPSRELVTVIIPARNEENNLGACLQSLMNQDYPEIEIIVVNDNSTDGTEAVLTSLCARKLNPAAPAPDQNGPLAYLNAPATLPGWTGKNHALHCAIPHARGKWFLFTDADTRHDPWSIRTAISHAQNRSLQMLSLTPRCTTKSFWEHWLQPVAMAFLGLWFPLTEANQPKKKTLFGNGQYFLMRQEAYRKLGGHKAVREEFLEDFAFSRLAKEKGLAYQCAMAPQVFGTRMYTSFAEIWRGWRRIYLHAFERRKTPLLSCFFSLLLFSCFPFIAFALLIPHALARPDIGFSLGTGAVVLFLILMTAWKSFGILRARKIYALLHPAAALILSMILLDAFWSAASGKPTRWR